MKTPDDTNPGLDLDDQKISEHKLGHELFFKTRSPL